MAVDTNMVLIPYSLKGFSGCLHSTLGGCVRQILNLCPSGNRGSVVTNRIG